VVRFVFWDAGELVEGVDGGMSGRSMLMMNSSCDDEIALCCEEESEGKARLHGSNNRKSAEKDLSEFLLPEPRVPVLY
jgi:hypothetical protein